MCIRKDSVFQCNKQETFQSLSWQKINGDLIFSFQFCLTAALCSLRCNKEKNNLDSAINLNNSNLYHEMYKH